MSDQLYNNIKSQGSCWNFFSQRIYHSLQISWDMVRDGHKIIDFFGDNADDNAEPFALKVKNAFTSSFGAADCPDDNMDCILQAFCYGVVDGQLTGGLDEDLADASVGQLRFACVAETWRFQDLIYSGELGDACEFDLTPVLSQAGWCRQPSGMLPVVNGTVQHPMMMMMGMGMEDGTEMEI